MAQKFVCNCNGTMPLDAKALGVTMHQSLCRQEVGSFLKGLNDSDSIVVACTQEASLFSELAAQSEKSLIAPLKFVNIREVAGAAGVAGKSGAAGSVMLAVCYDASRAFNRTKQKPAAPRFAPAPRRQRPRPAPVACPACVRFAQYAGAAQ